MFGKRKQAVLEFGVLTEQPDFNSVLRLLPQFNFRSIPADFIYQDSLVLQEKVEKDEDGVVHRTDYVITPKRGVIRLSSERVAIDSKLSVKIDDWIAAMASEDYEEHFKYKLFNGADIKRFLTQDGAEVYICNGINMIESKSNICKECKDCNETAPNWFYIDQDDKIKYGGNVRVINEVREYKINPPLLGLFFGTGVHIAEITHPCQYRSLHQLLHPGVKISDPPKVEIVFPK